jgi:hypothetical protein
MHAFWIILGTAVLIVAFVDVFLVVLNYDETGFLATRLCRLQWYCLRSVTRHLSRRWRPFALRQVTGLNVLLERDGLARMRRRRFRIHLLRPHGRGEL